MLCLLLHYPLFNVCGVKFNLNRLVEKIHTNGQISVFGLETTQLKCLNMLFICVSDRINVDRFKTKRIPTLTKLQLTLKAM